MDIFVVSRSVGYQGRAPFEMSVYRIYNLYCWFTLVLNLSQHSLSMFQAYHMVVRGCSDLWQRNILTLKASQHSSSFHPC